MKRHLILLLLLLSVPPTFCERFAASAESANPLLSEDGAPADSDQDTPERAAFCKRVDHPELVKNLGKDLNNLTGFNNAEGLFGATGVCWWHSRLQRSALYLTVFRPDLPAPQSEKEVHKILKELQTHSRVVEIGGYQNWKEFSSAWQPSFQKFLNNWQLGDSLVRAAWFDGLRDRGVLHGPAAAARLKKLMEAIVTRVNEKNEVTYIKLVQKFPESHAWLVVDAVPVANGVDLSVIDSNYSSYGSPFTFHYKYGDESGFNTDLGGLYGNFIPYVEHEGDFKRINRAIRTYCQADASVEQAGRQVMHDSAPR